jgi:hypothetical protein
MLSKAKVLGSNIDFVKSPPIKLNISGVEFYLLKGSLSPDVRENVKGLIK